ncbi:hypothetical protein BAUCODRAFT_34155 [Baudoinia panamericana UAMH 10762]|uniref:Uncharacterized protein n=1 Tax=Baudoinia panamericana (strain UAMH 10762) TaxID=717646 RepID=M2MYS3_BAUPA|nr:uncharacterized protein BAUCODRAFT_34155 [Baudoinia panamericana UAMH 10762]EMC96763.1 hypothetical protein BAUCODRAFT_34155 [Baudoinia panamericana UAMH 10762]
MVTSSLLTAAGNVGAKRAKNRRLTETNLPYRHPRTPRPYVRCYNMLNLQMPGFGT